LHIDDGVRALEFLAQAGILARQVLHLPRLGKARIGLASALARGESRLLATGALLAPGGEHRGVDAFTTQQCTELARLRAAIRFLHNPALLATGELATLRRRRDLRVRRRRACGPIYTRPTGSLRCVRKRRTRIAIHQGRFHPSSHESILPLL